MDKMEIYNHLPVWGQNVACSIEGFRIIRNRYGKQFWKYLEEYESRNKWTEEQLKEYRDKRLQHMIQYCYKNVPYYTKIFDEYGINPRSIKCLDDLNRLPVLTKGKVNEQPDKFISCIYPRGKMLSQHTSGTTGSGFHFQSTRKALLEQWAVWWRYRSKLGIEYGEKCAMFGGRSIVPVHQVKPPFYRRNQPGNQIYFSAYHMGDNNLKYYIEALEKSKSRWIHGYPSSIAVLAQYMINHDMKLSYEVEHITTGAENLLQHQKEVIRKAFGIEPHQHYGMAEGVANISEDKDHNWHIDEDFAAVEFLDCDDSPYKKIVGTSLTNYAMPLLRYEVGDIAKIFDSRRVISIDGRKEDYIVLDNGNKLGRLDHIFKDMVNIREAQIYQKVNREICVYIVKGQMYRNEDEIRLRDAIYERLGDQKYKIQYVDEIKKGKNGKLRFVISEVVS